MPTFTFETVARAPIERCFDLARDVGLHQRSLARTRETVIEGPTSGLLGPGEPVTWRGKHLGVWHTHTAIITAFDPPRHFRDEMVRGRFRSFRHDHHFEPCEGGTRMHEVLEYRAPLGVLGWMAEVLFLTRYLRALLRERAEIVRRVAERSE